MSDDEGANVDEKSLRAEFEVMARRAGAAIPDDRREALFAMFKDFRRVIARMHKPFDASVEVASVFSVESAKRGAPNRSAS